MRITKKIRGGNAPMEYAMLIDGDVAAFGQMVFHQNFATMKKNTFPSTLIYFEIFLLTYKEVDKSRLQMKPYKILIRFKK